MKLQRSKMASNSVEVSDRGMTHVDVPEGGGKAVSTSTSGGKKHAKVPKKNGNGGTNKTNWGTGDIKAVVIKQEGLEKVETQKNTIHFYPVKGNIPREAIEIDNRGGNR